MVDLFPGGEMVSQRRVDSLSAPRCVGGDFLCGSSNLFPGGEMVSQRRVDSLSAPRCVGSDFLCGSSDLFPGGEMVSQRTLNLSEPVSSPSDDKP